MAGKKGKKKQVKTPLSKLTSASPSPSSRTTTSACQVSSSDDPQEKPQCSEEQEQLPSPSTPVPESRLAKTCRHLERGIEPQKLSTIVSKSRFSFSNCQDCCKDAKGGSGKKNKAKSTRRKAVSQNSHEKKWICLACGHVACETLAANQENDSDKEGNRKMPSGHVWRHSLVAKHPVALLAGDNLICWCFMCNMAIEHSFNTSDDVEVNQQPSSSPILEEAVKIVSEKLIKETGFFKDPGKKGLSSRTGNESASPVLSSDALSPRMPISIQSSGVQKKRVVRGLMNLGNTCFFNSVMQNLLAIDVLREYFTQELHDSTGPLTASLRRLYLETNASEPVETSGNESTPKKGAKGRAVWESSGACSPKSLFGAICAKAPRFKGFQQQDSHELLRCLLDGLYSEERTAKIKSPGNKDDIKMSTSSSNGETEFPDPIVKKTKEKSSSVAETSITFVESVFGGQLCSTVRCCTCGHSSVVYEPMMDLSLQIPTRQIPTRQKGPTQKLENIPSAIRKSQKTHVKHTRRLQKSGSQGPAHALDLQAINDLCASTSHADQSVNNSHDSASHADQSVNNMCASSSHADQSEKLTVDGSASSKASNTPADSVTEDLGWLDFVCSGMQSAEGYLQGADDVLDYTKFNEKILITDVEESTSGKDVTTDNDDSKNLDISLPEVGNSFIESEVEDSPLPLATGVLLLPYEPLSAVGNTESTFEAYDPKPLSEEQDDMDGFSQLFEEAEDFPVTKPSSTCRVEEYQITEDSSLDDGIWEADSVALESYDNSAMPRSSVDYEEAFPAMSLEGCLADFTKPELLSGENAWECEGCSKCIKETKPSSANDITSRPLEKNGSNSVDCNTNCPVPHNAESENSEVACHTNGEPVSLASDQLSTEESLVPSVLNGGHVCNDNKTSASCNGEKLSTSSKTDQKKNMESGDSNEQDPNRNSNSKKITRGLRRSTRNNPSVKEEVQEESSDESSENCLKSEEVKKRVKRDATKKLSISKAPSILTVHLKRFAQDMRGRLNKINGHVSFPEFLDLRPFLDPRCMDLDGYVYRLVGIVEHGGTMRGGHYVAYVRGPCMEEAGDTMDRQSKDSWYYVSDSSVRKASLQAVLNSEAYLLFYEKCKLNGQM